MGVLKLQDLRSDTNDKNSRLSAAEVSKDISLMKSDEVRSEEPPSRQTHLLSFSYKESCSAASAKDNQEQLGPADIETACVNRTMESQEAQVDCLNVFSHFEKLNSTSQTHQRPTISCPRALLRTRIYLYYHPIKQSQFGQ